MNYIDRPHYIGQLMRWRNRDIIKVVTGVRRCGKSTVLEMFRNELRKTGVSEEQFVVLNFEDPDIPEFKAWKEAWGYIKPLLGKGKSIYNLGEKEI